MILSAVASPTPGSFIRSSLLAELMSTFGAAASFAFLAEWALGDCALGAGLFGVSWVCGAVIVPPCLSVESGGVMPWLCAASGSTAAIRNAHSMEILNDRFIRLLLGGLG